jgi:chemotaxis signal transduction protein
MTTQQAQTANLVEFQEKLLSKIADRATQANQAHLQWLGFVVDEVSYLVPLNRIKEVLAPPEKYLALGAWVHEGVRGGLQHRDEIWTVFRGVQCMMERGHSKGDAWDFRLLLLRQNEVEGNMAVAVDRVVGLVSHERWEHLQTKPWSFGVVGKVKNPSDGTVWNLWDPLVWKDTPEISNIASTIQTN